MKTNISTITINEHFEKKCGCPICSLEAMFENRSVDYITGSAMMEPDVRADTDFLGFCDKHFEMMLKTERRLNCAMILQTRLKYLENNFFSPKTSKPDKKYLAKFNDNTSSCYICNSINENMICLYNGITNHWIKSNDFRLLYSQQDYLCLTHFNKLINYAYNNIPSKYLGEFYSVSKELCIKKLNQCNIEIEDFCSLFDYRNRGKDFSKVGDSIEKTVDFLTKEKNTIKVDY